MTGGFAQKHKEKTQSGQFMFALTFKQGSSDTKICVGFGKIEQNSQKDEKKILVLLQINDHEKEHSIHTKFILPLDLDFAAPAPSKSIQLKQLHKLRDYQDLEVSQTALQKNEEALFNNTIGDQGKQQLLNFCENMKGIFAVVRKHEKIGSFGDSSLTRLQEKANSDETPDTSSKLYCIMQISPFYKNLSKSHG